MKANSVSTIERRLSAIAWNCTQRGMLLDRKDRAIATVMAGGRNRHTALPRQKEAILPEDLIAMLETPERGTLRGLRDRALLRAACVARKSPASTSDAIRPRTGAAGSRSSLLTLRCKTG
ncbi:hypothetical protein FHT71_003769 [Rhizobium sp. BK060]|nr:hypothetical protein [Rhizobium sp. BK060]